jgi:hypothetical protein
MRYEPMGVRERRWRRTVVIVVCAVALLAPTITGDHDSFALWAVMWGVTVALGTACWGLLGIALSHRDARAARKDRAAKSAPKAT